MDENFWENIVHDIQIDLTDEFDRNFERKAFFDKSWPQTKWANNKGSLMMRSGALRGSIRHQESGQGIAWSSSMPYADIQNEGGEITVTAKMKKFFWAMYYKVGGAVTTTKGGQASASQRNIRLTNEAAIWKSLALMKVGKKMHIPSRRFIGDHPQVEASIKRVFDENMYDLSIDVANQFKP